MKLNLSNPTDLTLGEVIAELREEALDGLLLTTATDGAVDAPETYGVLVWRDVHSARSLVEAFLQAARTLIKRGDISERALEAALLTKKSRVPSV